MTRKCPQCGEPASQDADNPHRPFCSERCQLLDLGGWLTEEYAIRGRTASEDELLDGDREQ